MGKVEFQVEIKYIFWNPSDLRSRAADEQSDLCKSLISFCILVDDDSRGTLVRLEIEIESGWTRTKRKIEIFDQPHACRGLQPIINFDIKNF